MERPTNAQSNLICRPFMGKKGGPLAQYNLIKGDTGLFSGKKHGKGEEGGREGGIWFGKETENEGGPQWNLVVNFWFG